MKVRSILSAAIVAVGLSTAAFADVTGKVTFDGKVQPRKPIVMTAVPACANQHPTPVLDEGLVVGKNKELANVVVAIKNPPAGGKVPSTPAVLTQKGCQYQPHVLAMMVGQELIVRNDDPFLHNVHALPENNTGFNFGQNNVDNNPGKKVAPMKVAEQFRVKCDVHPWMGAFFAVYEHPYFAVTKEDGTFTLAGLPDGEYEVEFWHEKLGSRDGKVSVKGGKGEVNIAIKPEEGADASPAIQLPEKTLNVSTETKAACPACAKAAAVAQK